MKKGLREPRKKALSFQGVLKSLTWTISIDLIGLFVGASVLLAAPKLFSDHAPDPVRRRERA
jgi:hypothetical protein